MSWEVIHFDLATKGEGRRGERREERGEGREGEGRGVEGREKGGEGETKRGGGEGEGREEKRGKGEKGREGKRREERERGKGDRERNEKFCHIKHIGLACKTKLSSNKNAPVLIIESPGAIIRGQPTSCHGEWGVRDDDTGDQNMSTWAAASGTGGLSLDQGTQLHTRGLPLLPGFTKKQYRLFL